MYWCPQRVVPIKSYLSGQHMLYSPLPPTDPATHHSQSHEQSQQSETNHCSQSTQHWDIRR